jgi:hypothetical protein
LFSGVEQQSKIDAVGNVSGTFNHLEFRNNGVIIGGHTIDSLIFSPGKSYQLDASKAQVVREYLQMNGNNCLSIGLSSTVAGQKSKVIMNGGTVSADFVQMRDQLAEGTTTWTMESWARISFCVKLLLSNSTAGPIAPGKPIAGVPGQSPRPYS